LVNATASTLLFKSSDEKTIQSRRFSQHCQIFALFLLRNSASSAADGIADFGKFHYFWSLEKFWKNPLVLPPGKNPSDAFDCFVENSVLTMQVPQHYTCKMKNINENSSTKVKNLKAKWFQPRIPS